MTKTHKGGAEEVSAITPKEQMLWLKVAATVRPLSSNKKGHGVEVVTPLPVLSPAPALSKSIALKPPAQKSVFHNDVASQAAVTSKPSVSHGGLPLLDHKSRRKISRGRLKIEARLDLHGLNREHAYTLLLHFVRHAQFQERRYVLVITGKGRSSQNEAESFRQGGVLQQLVPEWLATAPFRRYVSAVEAAAQHHGGSGAFYVKLRRQKEVSS